MGISQKKHKFNVIDAAIIIMLAAVIAVAILFFRTDIFRSEGEDGKSDSSAAPVLIEYEIEFREIRDEFTDNLIVGDNVVDTVKLIKLGQIVAVDVTDAVYVGSNLLTGELVSSDYPGYSNVTVTVSTDAVIGDDGRYCIGGEYDLSVGTLVSIRTPNYTGTAYCTQIRQLEGEK